MFYDVTDNGSTTSSSASTSSISHSASQLEDGKLRKLQDQWKLVWFAALERQKKLDDAKEHRRRNLSPEVSRDFTKNQLKLPLLSKIFLFTSTKN